MAYIVLRTTGVVLRTIDIVLGTTHLVPRTMHYRSLLLELLVTQWRIGPL